MRYCAAFLPTDCQICGIMLGLNYKFKSPPLSSTYSVQLVQNLKGEFSEGGAHRWYADHWGEASDQGLEKLGAYSAGLTSLKSVIC